MSNAINISKYVINKCIDYGKPISNLKLQKILYYIQAEFLVRLDNPIFLAEIEAWRHGPVVPESYYEFNSHIANNITNKINDCKMIKPEEMNIINNVIRKKMEFSAWKLVEMTHNEDPWKNNYVAGGNTVIPLQDIKDYFSKNR